MASATLVSLSKYSATAYRPDCEYIDGELRERNIGETDHSRLQALLSDDSMYDMQERIDDYLTMGVLHVWVVNPRSRRAFLYTSEFMREAKDGILRTTDPQIEVPISGLE